MSFIILMNGEKSQKYVDNKTQVIMPFIAAETNEISSKLGIGIHACCQSSRLFWGLLTPHPIVQTWRSMKALEQMREIRNATLCACWYIAKRNINYQDDAYYLRLFRGLFKNHRANFLRNKLLDMPTDMQELDRAISIMIENNISIDTWELQEELSTGHITLTESVQKALNINA